MNSLSMVTVVTLFLFIVGCNEMQPGDQPVVQDSSSQSQTAHTAIPGSDIITDTGTDAEPVSEIPAPSPEMAKDTMPLTAPDGSPLRFGVESGQIIQTYSGSKTGKRTIIFDKYGLRESKRDSAYPSSGDGKVIPNNTLFLLTPEFYGEFDFRTNYGWKVPNQALDRYLTSEYAGQYSLGEMILNSSKARRLDDTTLYGYQCRVYRLEHPAFIHTKWVWRGITLREKQYDPDNETTYTIETESIRLNTDIADNTFAFPDDYTIEDMPSPKPNELVPVPTPKKE